MVCRCVGMTGIGVTMEALSLFLHLSENKYDTAWSGGMKVGLSKRTRGEEGWMGWAVWILLHEGEFCLLCTTGVKKKNRKIMRVTDIPVVHQLGTCHPTS